MSAWRHGLAALGVWLAHFVIGYALILVFPDRAFVGWLILLLGIAALIGLAVLLRQAGRSAQSWAATLLAGIGIVFQSIVGLF